MVQYFSQLQFVSVRSHWPQTIGPGMEASWKTLPDVGRTQQARRSTMLRFVYYVGGLGAATVALLAFPLGGSAGVL
jgi:hypothetical protein